MTIDAGDLDNAGESYYNELDLKDATISRLTDQLNKAKRGLVWAWHGDIDTSVVDWDAYFESGDGK